MRQLFSLVLALATSYASAQVVRPLSGQTEQSYHLSGSNVLVLIDSANSGPRVEPNAIPEQMWVLWPTPLDEHGSNRFLSIFSGIDWQGNSFDLSFRADENGTKWISNNFDAIKSTGYFQARKQLVGNNQIECLSSRYNSGAVSEIALLTSVNGNSNVVKTLSFKSAWEFGKNVVYLAPSWKDQRAVVDRVTEAGGRVLTLEIPPRGNVQWGRMWLSTRGWPKGFPHSNDSRVPGLLRLRDTGKLLLYPDQFSWDSHPEQVDSVVNWFSHVRHFGAGVLACVAFSLLFLLGSAIYCISIEYPGKLASTLLKGIILTPAVFVLMDNISLSEGLDGWVMWLTLSILTLGLVTWVMKGLFSKLFPGSNSLAAVFATGLICMVSTNPEWSIYSGIFGYSSPNLSPESFGFLAGYLGGMVALLKESDGIWTGRLATIAVVAAAVFGKVWWSGDDPQYFVIPVMAWLAGEGWLSWPLMILCALVPNRHSDFIHHGIAWAPLFSYRYEGDVDALNIGRHFSALISPGFVILVFLIGGVVAFSDRFVLSQIKKIIHRDQRLYALPSITAALVLMGILNPNYWPAAVVTGYASIISIAIIGVSEL